MRSNGPTAFSRFAIVMGLMGSLAGCGGGGGGGVGSTPTPPVVSGPSTPVTPPTPPSPPAVDYDTSEYRRSGGAVAMDAIAAYDSGATGSGVTVAYLDTGIKTDSPEFSGRILSASKDIVANRGIVDTAGHGTEVAAIAAAARNDSGVMGVAFDSNLLVLRTDDPGSCASANGCSHFDNDLATAVNYAVINGARVVNISLGGSAPGSAFIDAIANAANNGVIVVIAAGNDAAANADGFALVANNAAAQNMVIIAGSHAANGTSLSSFSNAAGSGQEHYLAALGEGIQTINHNGQAVAGSGTSFATAQISGAAALLAQAFPNLTGAQIVQLLFDSAVDLGATGTDAVFGRGKLSLTRAFQPQGPTSLSSTSASVSLISNGSLGAPIGDGGRSGAALGGAIILDGYSRAYAVNLSSTLSRTPVNQSLAGRLGSFSRSFSGGAGNMMMSVTVDRSTANAQPWVGLAQTNLTAQDARVARATAGVIASRIAPGTQIAFGFSQSGVGVIDRLSGRASPAFLIARDPLATPGFEHRPGDVMAVRHAMGRTGLTMTMERGDVVSWSLRREQDSPYSLAAVRLDRRFGPLGLTLGLGVMKERDTLLGSRLGLVFGVSGATTRLADASAVLKLSDSWQLSGTVRQGWTRANLANGLVTGSNIVTRGFSADLSGTGVLAAGDRLGLRIAQPLRVENGGLRLAMPVAYDYATGTASIEARRMSLSPSGREIDVEASYGVALPKGWVDANLYLRRQPGHIADMPSDKGVALRFNMAF